LRSAPIAGRFRPAFHAMRKLARQGRGVTRPMRNIAYELRKETTKGIKNKTTRKVKEKKKESVVEKRNFGLYEKADRVLLVDEGNFTFALSLCSKLGDGSSVLATATESKAEISRLFPEAEGYRKVIEEKFGGTTLVGVDPTRLHKVTEFKGSFHKIVWLFPHISTEETDSEKLMEMHQTLFTRFIKSAFKCLDPKRGSAAIHVALTEGEPFKSWKLVQTAKNACAGLELMTVQKFNPEVWPGYERPSMFDPAEAEKEANLFVFCRGSVNQYS